jgi:hypothetical protein
MNKKLLIVALAVCLPASIVCAGCQSKQQAEVLAIQKKNAALPRAQFFAQFNDALQQHTHGAGMGDRPSGTPNVAAIRAAGQKR